MKQHIVSLLNLKTNRFQYIDKLQAQHKFRLNIP